jgi:hypothetical protein
VRGAQGITVERRALATKAVGLRREGLTFAVIAERLGVSRSYASELVMDADGSQARARKDSYAGKCSDCGASTSGSNGPGLAPERCATCERQFLTDNAKWTRETIIDAIQRFAAVHGRPPIADEWSHSDSKHGYPPRSAVYDSHNGKKHPPFPKWADAIEAAGFPRPTTGRRLVMANKRHGYTVLHEVEPGMWKEVGTYEVTAQILALNAALNGDEPTGRWMAIPGRYWHGRKLEPKTIYEFVAE